jgi:hypothetical protein
MSLLAMRAKRVMAVSPSPTARSLSDRSGTRAGRTFLIEGFPGIPDHRTIPDCSVVSVAAQKLLETIISGTASVHDLPSLKRSVFSTGGSESNRGFFYSQTARNILSGEVPHSAHPHLDDQTDPGLTGAHGSSATILEPNAENREAVCSQPRRFSPSGDGQT